MKTCFKCKETKDYSLFYRHKTMSDGYLGKCINCAKSDVIAHRNANIEKIRKYDRDRAKHPHRIASRIEITKAARLKDKRYSQCHNAVAKAVRKGSLEKKHCETCGETKVHAHHDNYNEPLNIIWLCAICHKKRHKFLEINGIDPYNYEGRTI